jgi:predicted nucleic acid-binding protein
LTVFLDTSAVLAVLDGDDLRHPEADAIWKRLLGSGESMLSTNYVLVETFALVQRRLGLEAVRAIEREIVPLLDLHWLDAELHRASVAQWLAASRRGLSLVDCSSFEVMRRQNVPCAFAFDAHYEEQGFELLRA